MKTSRGATLIAMLAVWGGSGCTFSEGEPYGLVSASLEARYELRDDRDVGDGSWQKLTSEMEVRLDESGLVELIDAGTGAAGLSFDPANPPPGYTLCHNGHCHSTGGELGLNVLVVHEIAGGEGATSTTALALQSGTQDLLSDEIVALDCGPVGGDPARECQLGVGYVSLVRATASRLELGGLLRDGLAEPRFDGERPFEATVSLLPTADDDATSGVLETAVDLPLDDESASRITLSLTIVPSAAMFDGLVPETIAADPEPTLSLDDEPSLRARFAELALGVGIRRTDP